MTIFRPFGTKRLLEQRFSGILLAASFFVIAAAVIFSGCDLIGSGEEETEAATMSIQLTDAPASSIVEANVVVRSIYLQGAEDEGRDTLMNEPTDPINLLELRDRTMELVADHPLEPGTYSQLRLVLGEVELVTEDRTYTNSSPGGPGAQGSLICPSCSQSGLKINLPDGGLTIDETTDFQRTFVLDFDVSQSFGHKAGRSGKWVMHPVITATEADVSGRVEGQVNFASDDVLPASCASVAPSVEEFKPLLRSAATDSVVKSGMARPDSSYAINFVHPGTYVAGFADTVDIGSQDSVLVFNGTPSAQEIDVTAGESTSLDYEVASVSCVVAP